MSAIDDIYIYIYMLQSLPSLDSLFRKLLQSSPLLMMRKLPRKLFKKPLPPLPPEKPPSRERRPSPVLNPNPKETPSPKLAATLLSLLLPLRVQKLLLSQRLPLTQRRQQSVTVLILLL